MSSSISNNFETLGREEEMLEKLIFWFLTLSPPLSIACFAAGEKLLNELEKNDPHFPIDLETRVAPCKANVNIIHWKH